MKNLAIGILATALLMSPPDPAGAGTNLNSSKSNLYRDACAGRPNGAKVKVEGKTMTCQAGLAVSDDGGPQGPPKKPGNK